MHKKMYLKKQQQTLQIYLIRFEENGLQLNMETFCNKRTFIVSDKFKFTVTFTSNQFESFSKK